MRRRSSAAVQQADINVDKDGDDVHAPLRWSRVSSIASSQPISPQRSRRPLLLWLVAALAFAIFLTALSRSSVKITQYHATPTSPRIAKVPAPYTDLYELDKGVQLGKQEPDWTLLKDWIFADNKHLPQECLTFEVRPRLALSVPDMLMPFTATIWPISGIIAGQDAYTANAGRNDRLSLAHHARSHH